MDSNFFPTGEIVFRLHGEELKIEIQNILYDLVRENMPHWKQMRVLEVVAAIVAETMIENGVMILTEPVEIHWPHGMVSKPNPTPRSKKGKKIQKQRHGIFGELVATLAPTVPSIATGENKENSNPPQQNATAKRSTRTCKSNKPAETVVRPPMDDDAGEGGKDTEVASHKGLPVQGRRGL